MNWVFWFAIILIAALIWYILRRIFQFIGGSVIKRANGLNRIMHDEDEKEPEPVFKDDIDFESAKQQFEIYMNKYLK